MRNVLGHARRILTMGAGEALAAAYWPYLRLFRRHLLPCVLALRLALA